MKKTIIALLSSILLIDACSTLKTNLYGTAESPEENTETELKLPTYVTFKAGLSKNNRIAIYKGSPEDGFTIVSVPSEPRIKVEREIARPRFDLSSNKQPIEFSY